MSTWEFKEGRFLKVTKLQNFTRSGTAAIAAECRVIDGTLQCKKKDTDKNKH